MGKSNRSERMFLCVIYGLLKSFCFHKPYFNDTKTEGIWLLWRSFEDHAKLFKSRNQRVHINNKFISERDAISEVPQGYIDGPLLLRLFINGLIFIIEQRALSSYADNNNLYVSGSEK